MLKPLELYIEVEPVPLARSRVVFSGGKVHSYTPQKSFEFEQYLKVYLEKYKEYYFPQGTPIKLTVCFYRTKSHWLKKAELLPYRRPDLDNFCKSLYDSGNGILWYDDCQITAMIAEKRWTVKEYPYIYLKIEEDSL